MLKSMKMLKRVALLCAATVTLSGCITFPTAESNKVKVLWHNPPALERCEHLGSVIGSQGHFYDYWLHADRDMLWGTLNEMRIKVAALGGDTLYLYQPFDFTGSVTMLGNAYLCGGANASASASASAIDSASQGSTKPAEQTVTRSETQSSQ